MDKPADQLRTSPPSKLDLEVASAAAKAGQSQPETPPQVAAVEEAPVTPVRSAKEAINAMYAQDPSKRLSSYLASSAKEIINASTPKSTTDKKSASSLHHGSIQRKMESARPSASALFRMAKSKPSPSPKPTVNSADPLAKVTPTIIKRKTPKTDTSGTIPVVRTSLKLAPKKLARASAPRQNLSSKQGIHLKPARHQAAPGPNGSNRTIGGLVQDIVRPTVNIAQPMAHPSAPIVEPIHKPAAHPLDSIKRRFRPAPKGFATNNAATVRESYAEKPRGYLGQPETPAQAPIQTPIQSPVSRPDEAIHYYALTEPEAPITASATSSQTAEPAAPLGVVQEYNASDRVENRPLTEQTVATGHGNSAPDNNHYALGGQSPFFLKTVSVEKRPLYDGPTTRASSSTSSSSRSSSTTSTTSRSKKKNVYAEKPKKQKKPAKKSSKKKTTRAQELPTRPTVIIPSSHRSSVPLVFLLLLTIILGAVVGAVAYLCFFQ